MIQCDILNIFGMFQVVYEICEGAKDMDLKVAFELLMLHKHYVDGSRI
jgi:hypothetical protein